MDMAQTFWGKAGDARGRSRTRSRRRAPMPTPAGRGCRGGVQKLSRPVLWAGRRGASRPGLQRGVEVRSRRAAGRPYRVRRAHRPRGASGLPRLRSGIALRAGRRPTQFTARTCVTHFAHRQRADAAARHVARAVAARRARATRRSRGPGTTAAARLRTGGRGEAPVRQQGSRGRSAPSKRLAGTGERGSRSRQWGEHNAGKPPIRSQRAPASWGSTAHRWARPAASLAGLSDELRRR